MNSSRPARRPRLGLVLAALALALGLLGASAASASAVQFYVSPTGSDANAGTLAKPFATLGRAQTAVRAATPGMTADVIVNLRGGSYQMNSPLELSDAAGDSGQNGHKVIYRAYKYGTAGAEHPVLTGGKAVTGWTQVDPTRHIWRADVGSLANRQLYLDGKRLPQGAITAIPGKVTTTATGYTTTSTAPQSWADPSNIDLVYTSIGYSQGICGVESISGNATQTTITMDQPCFKWLTSTFTYNEEEPEKPLELEPPTSLQNSSTFLSAAGQWSIDRATAGHHYIYYRSSAAENPNTRSFVAPSKQTLISGSGTKSAPLHDVSFQGIGFENTTWTGPNGPKGFVHIIGDYYYVGGSPSGSLEEPTTEVLFVPGGLSFEFTKGLLFEGNRFIHLGGDALKITGSINNTFRGNVFAEDAAGGLKLNGLDDGSDSGNLVEDNWIHDIGQDYQGGIAIYSEDIVASTFQHNQINHVPYSGIAETISEATGHGVKILNNRIYDVVEVMMDGGAIYTSLPQGPSYAEGALIEGNEVHGAINPRFQEMDPKGEVGAPNGIYADVEADYITLRNNVIYENHQSWGGVAPKHMKFEHNFWDDDQLVFYGSTKNLQIKENMLLGPTNPRADCEANTTCAGILSGSGLEPAWQWLLGT